MAELKPACKFIRDVFDDPALTEHDYEVIVDHTIECSSCSSFIGREINRRAKDGKSGG